MEYSSLKDSPVIDISSDEEKELGIIEISEDEDEWDVKIEEIEVASSSSSSSSMIPDLLGRDCDLAAAVPGSRPSDTPCLGVSSPLMLPNSSIAVQQRLELFAQSSGGSFPGGSLDNTKSSKLILPPSSLHKLGSFLGKVLQHPSSLKSPQITQLCMSSPAECVDDHSPARHLSGSDSEDCIHSPSSEPRGEPCSPSPRSWGSEGGGVKVTPSSISCPPSRRASRESDYRPQKVIGKIHRAPSPMVVEAVEELPDLECMCVKTTAGSSLQCSQCRLQDKSSPIQRKRGHGGCGDMGPAKFARLDRHFMDTLHNLHRSPSQSSLESIDVYGENGLFSQGDRGKAAPSRSASPTESYDSLPFVTLYPDELPDLDTETPSRRCSISSLESICPYQDGHFVYQRPQVSPLVEPNGPQQRVARVTNCVTRNACHWQAHWEAAAQDFRTVQRHIPTRWLVLRTAGESEQLGYPSRGETVDVRPFPEVALSICEAAQEEVEYSRCYVPQLASMVLDYSAGLYEPPVELVETLLQLLLTSHSHSQSSCLMRVLQHLASQFPPFGGLPFTWDDLCCLMESLALPYGIMNLSAERLYSLSQALNYMISMLESELLQRSFKSQRQVSRSMAYEWLSVDSQFSRVRQVLQWLGSALSFGEYESHSSSFLQQDDLDAAPLSRQPGKDAAHKILPLLQRLLQLSVSTARNPEETCNRMGIELGQIYLRAPGPHQRQLLLTSTVSPLLRYKAADHLLQTHCMRLDDSPATGSVCLQDVVDAYFSCDPPCSSFTPPPSPNDGEGGDSPGAQRHSEESVEELAMLLWTVVEGYIAFTKDKLYLSVTRRAELSPEENPSIRGDDLRTLRDFGDHVTRLRKWLKSLCGSLTTKTNIFLCQLESLTSLAE